MSRVLCVLVNNAGSTVPDAPDVTPVSDFDRAVFDAYKHYDFRDEHLVWPSQELVGKDLGRSKWSVHRSVKRLCAAGLMRLHEKRWGNYRGGRRWLHNVYELLEPGRPRFEAAEKRIIQRSLARRYWAARRRLGQVQLNHVVGSMKVDFSGFHRPRESPVMLR